VFILKVVKVLCFDTLLQVLILKGVSGMLYSLLRRKECGSIGVAKRYQAS